MRGLNPSGLLDRVKRLERPETGLLFVRTGRMHSEIKGELMEFDSLIEHVMISPNVLQVKEDYMYLYRSLEAEGMSQNTGDGFNMAFVLLDRAYQTMASLPITQVVTGEIKEDPETSSR